MNLDQPKTNCSCDQTEAVIEPKLRDRRMKSLLEYVVVGFNLFVTVVFPKCPVCWANYMGLIGISMFGVIPYQPWFLYVSIFLLAINTLFLFKKCKRIKDYRFLAVYLLSYFALLSFRYTDLMYGSIMASVIMSFAMGVIIFRTSLLKIKI